MEIGVINELVNLIGGQIAALIGVLVPIGQAVASAVVIIATVFFGLSLANGYNHLFGPMIRYAFLGAITFWLLDVWPDLVMDVLHSSRDVVAMMVPGYTGPSSLFEMGNAIVARLELQGVSWSWHAPVDALFLAMAELLIWFGFAVVSIIAVISEVQLLLAAALSPLVLPFLALGITASIGAAPIRFLLSSAVKCIALGVICATIAGSVTQLVNVAGTDMVFTTNEVLVLLSLSLVSAVIAVGAGSVASGITGGNFGGGMGYSSVQHAGSVVSGAISSTQKIGQAGAAMASGGASAFARSGGAMGRAAGRVTRAVNNGRGPFGND